MVKSSIEHHIAVAHHQNYNSYFTEYSISGSIACLLAVTISECLTSLDTYKGKMHTLSLCFDP